MRQSRFSARVALHSVAWRAGSVAGALALLVSPAVRPADAQPAALLHAFQRCTSCEHGVERTVMLGSAAGDGIIERNHAEVRVDPRSGRYALFHIGGQRVPLFDRSGRFLRSIGKQGRGPGEIATLIDAQFHDGELLLVESTAQTLTVVDSMGAVRHESTLGVRAGRIQTTSDTGLLGLASIDRSPERVGLPLHVVQVATGRAVRDFGSSDGRWSISRPFAQRVLLGASCAPDALWIGSPGYFRFEQWATGGRLLRTVQGDFDWAPSDALRARQKFLRTQLDGFAVDAEDRLWTIVRIPESQDRTDLGRGREGFVLEEDADDAFDVRIDVLDLRSRRHIGTLTWPEALVGLVNSNGTVALQRVEYDSERVPRVALYTVTFGPRTSQP